MTGQVREQWEENGLPSGTYLRSQHSGSLRQANSKLKPTLGNSVTLQNPVSKF